MKGYISLGKVYFNVALSLRIAYVNSLLSGIVSVIVAVFVWRALYEAGGPQQIPLLTIITYAVLASLISVASDTRIAGDIEREVRKGTIETYLLKPMHVDIAFIAQGVGKAIFTTALVSLPAILIASLVLNQPLIGGTFQRLTLFSVSATFAVLISITIDVIVGLLAFWLTAVFGIDIMKASLIRVLGGAFVPLSLYPQWLKQVCEWLPFHLMFYSPVSMYLQTWSIESSLLLIAKQLVFLIALYATLRAIVTAIRGKLSLAGG